jgi:catechol 2,3-dioxygenase-like lactoylglutathione lyase family enzyme
MTTISFDHTIIPSTDKDRTTAFYSDMLRLPAARPEGPFAAIDLDNQVSLYIGGWDSTVRPQHYAFLVSEEDFTAIYAQILDRGVEHWADPHAKRPGEINHDDGGRGVYFRDPDANWLEVITRRYGDTAP